MTHAANAFTWVPYTISFYNTQTSGREANEIRELSGAIWHVFQPKSVADIGCGRGQFLKTFAELGCEVWGTDGVEAFKAGFLVKNVTVQDFRDGLILDMKEPDLILCLEVVEHLPSESANYVVRSIARSRAKTIVFSGGHPGQGGTGHINERPKSYWIERFKWEGRPVDALGTKLLLERWLGAVGNEPVCTWYRDNLVVFK